MKPQAKIHTRLHLQTFRSALRKSLTPAEATLWNALKNKQLAGRKFRRQHSIDNFIVDFYCAEEKLVIELDGQIHFNDLASQNDAKRDEHLSGLGMTVLRFENRQVFDDGRCTLGNSSPV
jgi:very-short-patch-repair endonuclease